MSCKWNSSLQYQLHYGCIDVLIYKQTQKPKWLDVAPGTTFSGHEGTKMREAGLNLTWSRNWPTEIGCVPETLFFVLPYFTQLGGGGWCAGNTSLIYPLFQSFTTFLSGGCGVRPGSPFPKRHCTRFKHPSWMECKFWEHWQISSMLLALGCATIDLLILSLTRTTERSEK